MAEKKQSAADKKAAGDKKSALETALAQIEKQFGKGAVMKLGQNVTMQVDAISTGSISLDMALGIGGLPRGRIVEIYGPEASGKTTLALHCIAEAQKGGGEVAFIDVEHALDPVYAKALGVDIDSLLVSQPDTGEQALEICEALVRSGAIDCVVVDSVAAMVPRAEIEGEMGDAHVGLQARLMSQAMRKLTGIIGKTGTVVIFINQLRLKVGIVLIKASYFSIRNITLGYTLPKNLMQKFGIEKLRIYATADNLALWSKRQGFDPRVAMAGADDEYGGYSPMRVISGGINLTF